MIFRLKRISLWLKSLGFIWYQPMAEVFRVFKKNVGVVQWQPIALPLGKFLSAIACAGLPEINCFILLITPVKGNAGVVQWQNASFPSLTRRFDSAHPLHNGKWLIVNGEWQMANGK